MGSIHSLYVCSSAGEEMKQVNSLSLIENKGIEGDRYFLAQGTFSEVLAGTPDHQLTLIASEEIDRFNRNNKMNHSYGSFRRSIVTKGIELNPLVGKQIKIGNAIIEVIRFCEPCSHLAKVLTPEVLPQMVGKCGLRAKIIKSGKVSLEQEIEIHS